MKKPLRDWRAERLSQIRSLIKLADPKVTEEVKYRTRTNPAGVPVWYHDGMICTGETYKEHLRLTFSKGRALRKMDTKGVLNAFTAVVLKEHDKLNISAFKKLIRDAVQLNQKPAKKKQAVNRRTA